MSFKKEGKAFDSKKKIEERKSEASSSFSFPYTIKRY